MILKAVKPSPKSAGSPQGYIPEDGPQGKKPSIEAEGEKARRTIQASNGRKNLSSSGRTATPLERSVAHALTKTARTLNVRLRQAAQHRVQMARVRSANVSS
jgi:hypothetical protein